MERVVTLILHRIVCCVYIWWNSDLLHDGDPAMFCPLVSRTKSDLIAERNRSLGLLVSLCHVLPSLWSRGTKVSKDPMCCALMCTQNCKKGECGVYFVTMKLQLQPSVTNARTAGLCPDPLLIITHLCFVSNTHQHPVDYVALQWWMNNSCRYPFI